MKSTYHAIHIDLTIIYYYIHKKSKLYKPILLKQILYLQNNPQTLKNYEKISFFKWIPPIGICLLTFIFSCIEEFPLKDLSLSGKQPDRYQNTELTKSVAKQWYESNYKPIVTTIANYDDSIVNMMKPTKQNYILTYGKPNICTII